MAQSLQTCVETEDGDVVSLVQHLPRMYKFHPQHHQEKFKIVTYTLKYIKKKLARGLEEPCGMPFFVDSL